MQDSLELTCDRVYHWRLLLEEYDPKIVYIKGMHNIVADVILHLAFGPSEDNIKNWMIFTKWWFFYTMHTAIHPHPITKCS